LLFRCLFLHLLVCLDCNDIKSFGSEVTQIIHCLVFSNPARALKSPRARN